MVLKPATLDNGDAMSKKEFSDTPGQSSKPSGGIPRRGIRKKTWLAVGALAAIFLFVAVSAALLKPDIFTITKSSRAYSILRTIVPETSLDRFTDQSKQGAPSVAVKKKIATPPHHAAPVYRLVKEEGSEYRSTKKWIPWYIIELRDGEKIITRKALETNGVITVVGPSGEGKSFPRDSIKNVEKVLL